MAGTRKGTLFFRRFPAFVMWRKPRTGGFIRLPRRFGSGKPSAPRIAAEPLDSTL